MRQLDSCDFCGNAPEGVFEVVPASVAGEARRLALCANCRNTLQSVTDPLLDAAESGGSPGSESAATSRDTDVASHELDATPGDGASANAGDDPGDSTATEPNTDRSGTAQSEGVTQSTDAIADPNDNPTTDNPAVGGPGDDESATDESAADASEDDGVTIDSSTSNQQRERKPEGYAQVVRLLQNREGGMPREDLRALATNAYDLGGTQFEDAVDAAVENGDLQETGDGLQTE